MIEVWDPGGLHLPRLRAFLIAANDAESIALDVREHHPSGAVRISAVGDLLGSEPQHAHDLVVSSTVRWREIEVGPTIDIREVVDLDEQQAVTGGRIEPSDDLTSELQSLVKQAKGPQQSPKTIDYVDAVPLTAVGKPDKKAVRGRYWSGIDRSVG